MGFIFVLICGLFMVFGVCVDVCVVGCCLFLASVCCLLYCYIWVCDLCIFCDYVVGGVLLWGICVCFVV